MEARKVTKGLPLERMLNSLTLLLGMEVGTLSEMKEYMTKDQVEFFEWWKKAVHDLIYEDKPVLLDFGQTE